MKQGDKFLKITMILIAAAVFSYFGYALYGYFSSPLSTVTALEYEADAAPLLPAMSFGTSNFSPPPSPL